MKDIVYSGEAFKKLEDFIKLDYVDDSDDFFDPVKILEDFVRSRFDYSVLDFIDESDFKPAKNVFEFLTSKKFLGIDPYPRQLQVCLHLFADYCPVCSNPDFVNDMFDQSLEEILDNVVFLEHGVCPKCKVNRLKRMKQRLLRYYTEFVGCCGQRSGKSVLVSMIANYQLHRFLCIKNPSSYFHLLPNSMLHMTFVALTYSQADDTLWQPFMSLYDNCTWFKEYNKMLSEYEKKYGVYLFDVKKTFVFYNNKRIVVNPSGPDRRKLRGRTRIFCISEDSIVDTDLGGIPISSESIVGTKAVVADKFGKISGWQKAIAGPICELVTEHGFSLTGSADHHVCVKKNGSFTWKKMKDLVKGDVLIVSSYKANRDVKSKIDTSIFNLLGRVLGSGMFCSDSLVISSYQIHYRHGEFIDRIIRDICKLFGDKFGSLGRRQDRGLVEITNKDVVSFFRDSLYSSGFYINPSLYRLPFKGIVQFLKGFFEGSPLSSDGESEVIIDCDDGQISRLIQYLLLKIGIVSRRFGNKLSLLSIEDEDFALVCKFIMSESDEEDFNYYMDSLPKSLTFESRVYGVFDSIYRGLVYDISVDDLGCFSANNLVVHNSSIDELGWFKGDGVKYDAEGVYTALERSMRTIRSAAYKKIFEEKKFNTPTAISANISSPSSSNDMIMRLLRESKTDKSKYSIHYPTWLFNPYISRESLESEFRKDPIGARRDYGADPPLSDSPFFSNVDAVISCISSYDQYDIVSFKEVVEEYDEGVFKYLKVKFRNVDKSIPRCLGIDTGYSKNSFALCVTRLDKDNNIIIDLVLEASPSDGSKIDFVNMFEHCIVPVIENMNIKLAVFDRWQSVYISQNVMDYGVDSEIYSLTWEDFLYLRNLIYDNYVFFPIPEISVERIVKFNEKYETMVKNRPVANLILQLLTVREVGKRVEKGEFINDDIFRAMALSATFVDKEDYRDIFSNNAGINKKASGRRSVGFIRSYNPMGYGYSAGRFVGSSRPTTDGFRTSVGILKRY